MESQCQFFMYFPAAPISSLSDPSQYANLPRRKHVYHGETVQFLLVLRSRHAAERRDGSGGGLPWRDVMGSLSALASVCVAESRQQGPGDSEQPDLHSSHSEDGEEEEPSDTDGEGAGGGRRFRRCSPLHTHGKSAIDGQQSAREPVRSALVSDDQVIFCLSVSLDKLPVDTLKAKIIVTVWEQEDERVEVREHGYLTLLQLKSPTHTFRQDLSTFKTQVSTTLNVLQPPSVQCQQMTVSGKHLTVLKVLNCSSQEEVCVRDMKILPNYNLSYLPVMPDGSVLIVDNVCHKSAEITTASFYRLDNESSRLPSMLSALEEQNFLFQLQLQDKAEEESSEGLEVPLVAVLQWYTPTLHFTRYISSFYSLPSIRLDRPRLVMTASCPSTVRPLERFWVTYTLRNNLQDFLGVGLIWNSDAHRGGQQDTGKGSVVCQSPFNRLGQCRKGSSISFTVAFQILTTGLFELSQHMKLKLQFTASVPTPPPPPPPPPPPSSSPTTLLERHSPSQSQSFYQQHPSRSHQVSYPPPDSIISLEKIAKRDCKVFVQDTNPRRTQQMNWKGAFVYDPSD